MIEIPDTIYKRKDLTLSAKVVYGWFYARTWAGHRTLKVSNLEVVANRIRISFRNFYRIMGQLRDEDLVIYTYNRPQVSGILSEIRLNKEFLFSAKKKIPIQRKSNIIIEA